MSVGNWTINVSVDGMPQKVATGIGQLNEKFVGAEYSPIAYLGSQIVNGTNHAVLAEQLVTTGKDTKNVVIIIFNEKPGDMDVTLVNIERVIESGDEFGGTKVAVEVGDKINKTAMRLFESSFNGFVGSVVTPFALLATQPVRGTDYIFACEVNPIVANKGEDNKKAAIVRVNDMNSVAPAFTDLLASKSNMFGYAFTWLGAPLGEWP